MAQPTGFDFGVFTKLTLIKHAWSKFAWTQFTLLLVAGCVSIGIAEETSAPADAASDGDRVAQVASAAKASVVIIRSGDRSGDVAGLGSGFVVDQQQALIATNLHVIGEGRPIWVELPDGTKRDVIEVFASDHKLDLAVLRVESLPVTALDLADEPLQDAERVVAVGHPLGLKYSIVDGRMAGDRQFGSTPMWQLAMGIEPGNSGGPLLDLDGQVHGVMTLKSISGSKAFGFAVKSSALQKLLAHPNPIKMDQWLTLGQVDTTLWIPKFPSRWTQRSGLLHVEGMGAGYGGRSLLLRREPLQKIPFEVAVWVRLDDAAGAAGLVFNCDDRERHFGFYPSNGRMRLSRFDGPNVLQWNVRREIETPLYRPGEWNELKLRVEKDRVVAFVNGQELLQWETKIPLLGQCGLCKFRDTQASFRDFRIGPKVSSRLPNEADQQRVAEFIAGLPSRQTATDESLWLDADRRDDVDWIRADLQRQAKALEMAAEEKRKFAADLHVANTANQLAKLVDSRNDFDLLQAALLIARLDNHELQTVPYTDQVDRMARQILARLDDEATSHDRLAGLDEYLFRENGFHGSRLDYYTAENSHLDRVIDDREGLPITLSVLYLSLAQRLELPVVGVGLPGHFVVRYEPPSGDSELIDVFEQGERLDREAAAAIVRRLTGKRLRDADLESTDSRTIVLRILQNLYNVAESEVDHQAMLRYLEAMVRIKPQDASLRGLRAVLRRQQGRIAAAVADLDQVIESRPPELNLETLYEMRRLFLQEQASE